MKQAPHNATPSHDGLSWDVAAFEAMFRPRSIAIIGMSERPHSAGQFVLRNLEMSGFDGYVHLVGRNAGEICGRPCLASIDDLPEGVDLAILAIPAGAVKGAIEACVRRKVKSAIAFAAGFAELGDDARAEQAEITRIAQDGQLALVGPNCFGLKNFVSGLQIGFVPYEPLRPYTPEAGPGIAILAQSGGIGGHISGSLYAAEAACTYLITFGNEAGVGLAEGIEFLTRDAATGVIAIYAEQIRRPTRFLAAVAAARAAGKHVVLMHPGRSEKAQAMVASHTGALAGDHAVTRIALERAGVAFVDALEELMDVSRVLARYPVPPVTGSGLLTISGAMCALAEDYCETAALPFPPLSPAQRDQLGAAMPAFVSPSNPLDLGGDAQPDLILAGARALIEDPAMGSLISTLPAAESMLGAIWAQKLAEAGAACDKPVIAVFMEEGGPLHPKLAETVRANRMILMRSPERAFRTMAQLTRYGAAGVSGSVSARPLAGELPIMGAGPQPEWLGKQVLRQIGIAVPEGALATSVEEAAGIAAQIGYPVAMKAQSALLAHKTEANAVLLNIADEAQLRSAWDRLHTNVAAVRPDITLDGVLVEKMGQMGLELAIGAKRHPDWGPMLMVGLGGIFIEALSDVCLMPADLPAPAIVERLLSLKGAKLLGAFRGRPAIDLDAVAGAVAALGDLMRHDPDILELDINPLVARPDGVTAFDALIIRSGVAQ